jgi:hypothetical protein
LLLVAASASASFHVSAQFSLDLSYRLNDSDADGMEDGWEASHGLIVGADDRAEDPDVDGRTNLQEYNAGTDPQVADAEIAFGWSGLFGLRMGARPLDTDGDGMPDAWETAHGLNPGADDSAADPDADGILNLQEYNGGWHPGVAELAVLSRSVSAIGLLDTGACPYGFGTDTDGDGMPDWWELKYGLNRTVNDAGGDPDGDGFSNLTEYRVGMLPNHDDLWGMVWALSPEFLLDTIGISPDTDGDGMRDWWEDLHGLNRLVRDGHLDADGDGRTNLQEYNANTDPRVDDWRGPSLWASLAFIADTGGFRGGLADDTDSDGMPDWWEIKYGLQPAVNDSGGNPDGDALANLEEYNSGSDPLAFDFLIIQDAEGNLFVLDTGGRYLDADGDLIPNWWEKRYAGNPTNMLAGADSDGDGVPNVGEFIGRTNPGDRNSVFQIDAETRINPEHPWEWMLSWDSAPDRIYKVYSHTNLTSAWPATPVYQIEGDGTPKSYTNTEQIVHPRFFKITVETIPPP